MFKRYKIFLFDFSNAFWICYYFISKLAYILEVNFADLTLIFVLDHDILFWTKAVRIEHFLWEFLCHICVEGLLVSICNNFHILIEFGDQLCRIVWSLLNTYVVLYEIDKWFFLDSVDEYLDSLGKLVGSSIDVQMSENNLSESLILELLKLFPVVKHNALFFCSGSYDSEVTLIVLVAFSIELDN